MTNDVTLPYGLVDLALAVAKLADGYVGIRLTEPVEDQCDLLRCKRHIEALISTLDDALEGKAL